MEPRYFIYPGGFMTWFIFPDPKPNAKVRLFCFHCAGSNAALFSPWAKQLGPDQELIAVQLPGRGTQFGKPLLTDMNSVISYLSDAIQPYCDRPFVFFGHSLGALIAYELAHKLKTLPECLVVAGRSPPHYASNRLTYHLPDKMFIEFIKEYNGIPIEVLRDEGLMSLFLPILRADFQILETYVYQERVPLPCDLIALGGSEDHMVNPQHMQEWKPYTSGKFDFRLFSGDHFFIKSHHADILKLFLKEKCYAGRY